jgi:hypothetical protein
MPSRTHRASTARPTKAPAAAPLRPRTSPQRPGNKPHSTRPAKPTAHPVAGKSAPKAAAKPVPKPLPRPQGKPSAQQGKAPAKSAQKPRVNARAKSPPRTAPNAAAKAHPVAAPRPAAKPPRKPAAAPQKPASKAPEKFAATPPQKPAAKAPQKPAAKATEKATAKPAARPAQKPGSRPPASRPGARPAKATKPIRPPKPPAPPLPAYVQVSQQVPRLGTPRFTVEDAAQMERAFGWTFPPEARRLMAGLQVLDLEGGAAEVPDLATLKRLNLLDGGPMEATSFTASRLGLFCVARDSADNRFLMDVADLSGNCPIWLCSSRLSLAASAVPIYPRATDMLHCMGLYTLGKPARDAAADVERLTAELEALRKRRPSLFHGRDDALARLQAAFGGGAAAASAAGPIPSAEDEGRLAGELEAARDRHRALWMPFMEQFARWSVYWRLLWNGPQSFTVGTDTQDVPLLQAWRTTLPIGVAMAGGRVEALATELAQRAPVGRALLAFAEAHVRVGQTQQARALMDQWDAAVLGPRPPRADALFNTEGSAAGAPSDPSAQEREGVDWPAVLKLSRPKTARFFQALGSQFAQDLERHGTTNLLGATKAQVRDNGMGSRIVEAGLGHVPLEVRKDLFEGRPVQLSGQFLQALTRELSRRLHQPARTVEKTLTRLRDTLEKHINDRASLAVPNVGLFRLKNEPAPSGAPRFYLLVDVDAALVAAAQKTVIVQTHADYSDYQTSADLD